MYTVRCCHGIHLRQSHCLRQLFYSPAPTEDSPTCSPNTLSYLLSNTDTADAPGPFNIPPPGFSNVCRRIAALLLIYAAALSGWCEMRTSILFLYITAIWGFLLHKTDYGKKSRHSLVKFFRAIPYRLSHWKVYCINEYVYTHTFIH